MYSVNEAAVHVILLISLFHCKCSYKASVCQVMTFHLQSTEDMNRQTFLTDKVSCKKPVYYQYCGATPKSRILWCPLLRNGHNKNAYFSGNEHISRRYLGNKEWKHVPATTNTLQQGVYYSVREAPLKRVDFDS
jgi:hypothetical protein